MDCKCWVCRGTGAMNPDAGHSMEALDYLPCLACKGTGFSPEALEAMKARRHAREQKP